MLLLEHGQRQGGVGGKWPMDRGLVGRHRRGASPRLALRRLHAMLEAQRLLDGT